MRLYLVYENLPQGDRLYYAGTGEEGPFRTYTEWSTDREKAALVSPRAAARMVESSTTKELFLEHYKRDIEGDDIYALAERSY